MTKIITTVDYNSLKVMARGAGSYLLWEGRDRFEIYWLNQGPVVFRAVVKKDKATLGFVAGLKNVVVVKDRLLDPAVEITKLLKDINRKK